MKNRVKKTNRTQRDSNTSSGLCIFFQFIMTSNNQQTVQTRQGDKIVNYSSGEGEKSAEQVIGTETGNAKWNLKLARLERARLMLQHHSIE